MTYEMKQPLPEVINDKASRVRKGGFSKYNEMKLQGVPDAEIARYFNVSTQTAYRWNKAYVAMNGIRPPSWADKKEEPRARP